MSAELMLRLDQTIQGDSGEIHMELFDSRTEGCAYYVAVKRQL